jgi:tetratricopeptide (TPR) repeat protein
MAQDQTLTSSARNPALEQLIESGLECLNQAENTSEDWLYDLYIADARKEFRRAVEIAPDEPWLWFQIGWLNLIDDDEIDDPEPIRTALQRALDLDPDLVAAHVALAYVEAKVSVARHSNT